MRFYILLLVILLNFFQTQLATAANVVKTFNIGKNTATGIRFLLDGDELIYSQSTKQPGDETGTFTLSKINSNNEKTVIVENSQGFPLKIAKSLSGKYLISSNIISTASNSEFSLLEISSNGEQDVIEKFRTIEDFIQVAEQEYLVVGSKYNSTQLRTDLLHLRGKKQKSVFGVEAPRFLYRALELDSGFLIESIRGRDFSDPCCSENTTELKILKPKKSFKKKWKAKNLFSLSSQFEVVKIAVIDDFIYLVTSDRENGGAIIRKIENGVETVVAQIPTTSVHFSKNAIFYVDSETSSSIGLIKKIDASGTQTVITFTYQTVPFTGISEIVSTSDLDTMLINSIGDSQISIVGDLGIDLAIVKQE